MPDQPREPATDEKVLSKFERASVGASDALLDDVARKLNVKFPADYLAFMRRSNGGEGFLGEEGYLVLWPVEELVTANEGYKTAEFFPDWVFIGSNGDGEAVAVSRAATEPTVALVPFIGSQTDALVGGPTLRAFMDAYGAGSIWPNRGRTR